MNKLHEFIQGKLPERDMTYC